VRLEPKDFRIRRPNGTDDWIWDLNGTPRVLYKLPELLRSKSNEVLITEGEKDCDIALKNGFTTTTNVLGCKNWRREYDSYFQGKDVFIIEDNDPKGRNRTEILLNHLSGIANSLKVISFSDILPFEHSDLSDYLEKYSAEDLRELIDSTPPLELENSPKSQTKIESVSVDLCDLNHTDSGNAEAIIMLFGDKIRYDHTRRKWFIFDNHYWRLDRDGEAERIALQTVRERYRFAADIDDENKRKSLVKWALASENDCKIKAALEMASKMKPIATLREKFDTDPYLLGCKNGVIELRTAKFRPGKPEDMISMTTNVEYDANADCPLWKKTVSDIFDGDTGRIQFFQKYAGYSLTGDTKEQTMVFNIGGGANGKGIVTNTSHGVLGDYAGNTPFSTFLSSKRDGDKIPNDVAALCGKRFVTASEVREFSCFNEAIIKALTGGDPITARFMRGEWFTYTPTFKVWLSMNHKPNIRDTSYGFWRRIKVIPFERTFNAEERDNNLQEKLKAEYPGILNWFIEGCLAWQNEGLEPPEKVSIATNEYQTEMDIIKQFLDECTLTNPISQVSATQLFDAYKTWCDTNNEYKITKTMFGRKIAEIGFTKSRKTISNTKQVVYQGLGLLNNHEYKDTV